MNILFIHGNYPAQFRNLAADLGSQAKHDVRYLTAREDHDRFQLQGVNVIVYKDIQEDSCYASAAQSILNEQLRRAERIQNEIVNMIKGGFVPKLIIFHAGNGLGTLIKQIIPDSILIGYFEWYFTKDCARLILSRCDRESDNFIHSRNIFMENELIHCDAGIIPTEWQAKQFPSILRKKLNVIFDGIDLDFFRPADKLHKQDIKIEGEDSSICIAKDDLLITYMTRGMEPIRGFPEFMKSLPFLLRSNKKLKVIIGGRDRSAYGPPCPTHDGSWKKYMIDEIPQLKDHPRIIYTGLMNYSNYRTALQRTDLHFYFTRPYVTSWSLFEAIACGAPIICNRSGATSGTVNLDDRGLIENIEDIYTEEGIKKAMDIIRKIIPCENQLSDEYSIENAKAKWADLINKVIIGK